MHVQPYVCWPFWDSGNGQRGGFCDVLTFISFGYSSYDLCLYVHIVCFKWTLTCLNRIRCNLGSSWVMRRSLWQFCVGKLRGCGLRKSHQWYFSGGNIHKKNLVRSHSLTYWPDILIFLSLQVLPMFYFHKLEVLLVLDVVIALDIIYVLLYSI